MQSYVWTVRCHQRSKRGDNMKHYRQQVVVTIDFEFDAATEAERQEVAADNFETVEREITIAVDDYIYDCTNFTINDMCDEVHDNE